MSERIDVPESAKGMAFAQSFNGEKLPTRPSELPTFTGDSLARRLVPMREWFVENLIPQRNVTLLQANGGDGKSTLVQHLAVASVTGRKWLGRDVQKGPVIFFSAEDDQDELHRRLDAIVQHERIDYADLSSLTFVAMAGKDAVMAAPDSKDGLLRETKVFDGMRSVIDKIRPIFLVLDTLADIFGGDEIKKVQARQFITLLRGIAVEKQLAVLLISHPSQSGMVSGTGTSGNVAWSNSVRSRIYLERVRTTDGIEIDPDLRILTVKKSNYAKSGASIQMRYDHGVFVPEEAASPVAGPGLLRRAEEVFLDLLAQFEREGRTVSPTPSTNWAPKIFAEHPGGRGVGKAGFRTAMDTLLSDGSVLVETFGPPSRQRQKLVIGRSPQWSKGRLGSDD
jgi:RecA-family ATPase